MDNNRISMQASNTAKVDSATGKVRRREDGKILKPEGWEAPNTKGILAFAQVPGSFFDSWKI